MRGQCRTGFRMHTHPTVGEPQFVAKAVIDNLFPIGSRSRVPIVAVTGTNGKTTTARMLAAIFKGMGRKVGMTSTDGITIDQRLIIRADASGPKRAHGAAESARGLRSARGGTWRDPARGLGYDRNDVAVVTNVAPDHLGIGGINTLEQLADVKPSSSRRYRATGLRFSTPTIHWSPGCGGAVGRRDLVQSRRAGSARAAIAEAHCRRGGTAVLLDSGRAR